MEYKVHSISDIPDYIHDKIFRLLMTPFPPASFIYVEYFSWLCIFVYSFVGNWLDNKC